MIAGSVISAVASGLMLRFGLNTSTVYWAITLVLSGMGFGLGGQQCMMVPQTVLQGEDIALGTSVVSQLREQPPGEAWDGSKIRAMLTQSPRSCLPKRSRARCS
jgi:hypothetical protein